MLNLYLDVFKCLNRRKVKYVVIGGVAAVVHGVPRTTFDLDLLIEATPVNATRLLLALGDAGLMTATLTTAERLLAHEITIFRDWLQVDIQTRTPGLRFSTAWKNRRKVRASGTSIPFASRNDLIRSKRAAGRPIDLEDIRLLNLKMDRSQQPTSRKPRGDEQSATE